ncbi:hypothetical protein AAFF_G00229830 [Aldrovandia affinis]|uniref:Uncharacterized protein n=1 Tax=Aldrovandia affinis TaxID=143900 RepID=A0AAD7SWT8_9TELE|nr:hypothetical protein AAFF_G00229830 [Aldrovandia affinis]
MEPYTGFEWCCGKEMSHSHLYPLRARQGYLAHPFPTPRARISHRSHQEERTWPCLPPRLLNERASKHVSNADRHPTDGFCEKEPGFNWHGGLRYPSLSGANSSQAGRSGIDGFRES